MRGRNNQRPIPEAKSPRPRRSAFSRVFASLFLLLSLAVIAGLVAGFIGYGRYVAEGPLQAGKIFEVGKGLSTPEIATALHQNGIIDDEQVFTAAAILTGSRGRLKAGEYEFPAHASIQDVMAIISSGKAILYKVTIPEGWTTEMALNRIRENDVLLGELTRTPSEGEILPETYLFKRGKTRDEMVDDMVAAQVKLVDDLWNARASGIPVKTPHDAVVLASIVEKETGVPEERPQVAAVFSNRLRKGMRLQSDPTIIYGIVGGKGKLDRPLTKADIAQKTPYNTYQIDGLPPGPIANPGRLSLEAVLNPASSKALYFVADGSGGHAFADTLAEHNDNVKKWRNVERNRTLIEAQEEAAAADAGTQQPTATDPDASSEQPADTDQPAQKSQMPDMDSVAIDQPAESEPGTPDPSDGQQATTAAPDSTSSATSAADSSSPEQQTPPAGNETQTQAAVSAEPAASTPVASAANPPKPAEKPKVQQQQEQPVMEHKPGEIIRVANRLVPIPVPKPRLP